MELKVRVLRRQAETQDIEVFELGAAGGEPLPAFEAGAHIDVRTPAGVLRQYSLCGPPGGGAAYRIAVLREASGRGGSRAMHDQATAGTLLTIGAPRNAFRLVEDATHSILLAGGIGITPIVAMAERLHALGRDFVLHYAARSAGQAAFRERLARGPFARRVRFHHSGGDPARRLDIAAALGAHHPGRHFYACGPAGFLDAVRSCAAAAGWPGDAVHFERFQGVDARCAGDEGFDVVIRSSGAVVRVEAGQSVADALRANGIPVATSCEQGVCGTCLTRVLEGRVEHRDLFLTPEEQEGNETFLPCVSRARSARLVLDL